MPKSKTYLLFILWLVFAQTLRAEITGGYCSVKEELNGSETYSLHPGVFFLCQPANNIYQRIWVEVWVLNTDLYDGIRIQAKARLFGSNRKPCGKVLQSLNPLVLAETTDSLTRVILSGYLDLHCTRIQSVPETELSLLLEKASDNEKFSYFKAYLDTFSFAEQAPVNQYRSFLIQQPNFVKQQLEPRILMVFYKEELIAVFHTREVRVKKYDSIEMGKDYKMIYNSKFTEHNKEEMVKIYKKALMQD